MKKEEIENRNSPARYKNAFIYCKYDLGRSTRQKTKTHLTNLSKNGNFSSHTQIVTGITYSRK